MPKVPYANVVGCLMYDMICARPHLEHVISQVCKFLSMLGMQLSGSSGT